LAWWLTDKEYRSKHSAMRRHRSAIVAAQNSVGRALIREKGAVVQNGPFEGMIYHERIAGVVPTHKLLGVYEKELWPVINTICRTDYSCIVDIGAADGYYVVGLARRISGAKVIAYEAQVQLHRLIRELAASNCVSDQIEINGTCDAESLSAALDGKGRCLIVCDIEGAEEVVLDPMRVPVLGTSDILVEIHDHLCPEVSCKLIDRFQVTHDIAEIESVARTREDYPFSHSGDVDLLVQAMNECRDPANKWFWMSVRGN
jgi:hypothetical protein